MNPFATTTMMLALLCTAAGCAQAPAEGGGPAPAPPSSPDGGSAAVQDAAPTVDADPHAGHVDADAGPAHAGHDAVDDEVNGHGQHDPRPAPNLIPDGGDPRRAANFTTIFTHILRPSCAAGPCHGAASSAYLNLTDKDAAHASLLEQEALGQPCFDQGHTRVIPGAPDRSLLIKKLEGTACGARMPKDAAPLAPEHIELIRAWIYAGAKND